MLTPAPEVEQARRTAITGIGSGQRIGDGNRCTDGPSKSCDLSNLTWVVSRYYELLALP